MNAPEAYDPLSHDTYGNVVEGYENDAVKIRSWRRTRSSVSTVLVMVFVALIAYVLTKKAKGRVFSGGAPDVATTVASACDTTNIKVALEALKAIRLQ